MKKRILLMLVVIALVALFFFSQKKEPQPPSDRHERIIYLKLPLLQPKYHWAFTEEEKLMNSELSLTVDTGEKAFSLPIIQNGSLSPDWERLGKGNKNGFYYGFKSKKQYPVSENDNVRLVLNTEEDLDGIGHDFTGILKSGLYRSYAQFTLYHLQDSTGEPDIYAFLNYNDWHPRWELEITSNDGWGKNKNNTEIE